MDSVDLRWAGAIGPGQAPVRGSAGFQVAVGDAFVVGPAREEQQIGVGATVGVPVGTVVDLAVVTGFQAVRPGATAVACVADDALIGCGDPRLATQVQRTAGVFVEHCQVMNGVSRHPDQIPHR